MALGAAREGSHKNATIGIENAAGDIALQYSYNEAAVESGTAVLYEVPCSGFVQGVISDANDGATVAATNTDGEVRVARSGSAGTYLLQLTQGYYTLDITKPNYATSCTSPDWAIPGLAYNSSADVLWMATNSETDTIYELNPDDCTLLSTLAPPQGGSYQGAGLELDVEGNLWAVAQSPNQVYLIESGVPSFGDIPWLVAEPASGAVGLDRSKPSRSPSTPRASSRVSIWAR